jgi:hypothetical protein
VAPALTICRWRDGQREDEHALGTPSRVEAAVRALDGHDLYIEYPGTVYMLVGGGPRWFHVFACYDNRRFRTLARPDANGEPPVELVTGGQRSLFTARHVVEADLAVAAAWQWASTGTLLAGRVWDAD